MVSKGKNQKITAATIIGIGTILAALYIYYDGIAPQYNYSFSDRTPNRPPAVLNVDKGFHEIAVFAQNKGKSDGTIRLSVTAMNATFTNQQGTETLDSVTFDKKAIVGDGWTGNDVFVRPNPGSSEFTLYLGGTGQDALSDSYPADPVQITYKKTFSGWYELKR